MEDKQASTLIKLSASSTKTYDSCARKYRYTYIDKLPKKEWDHLKLGTFCHNVLEQFHEEWKNDKNLELRPLMSRSFANQRHLASLDPKTKLADEQLTEAKGMLQDYLYSMERNGMPNVLGVEDGFEMVVGNKYVLRGFLDRLDVDKDGLFHIVDYKTTKNEKYLDSFQLLVYGLALKQKYPDLKRFRGSYVLLRKGSKMLTNEYTLNDILGCEKKIIEYGTAIENEKKWEKTITRLCDWCDFKDVCLGNVNDTWIK